MSRHSPGEHREAEVESFSNSTWWEFEWLTGAAAFIISNHWKTPLVPTPGCGCTYWSCLRFQVVEASVGHLVPLGLLPAPWFPGRVAGSAHVLEGCPHSWCFRQSVWWGKAAPCPGCTPIGVHWQPLCCCKDKNFDLPSSEKSKVVGRIERGEEVTEHITTQRYCPPPGNPPNMGESFLCQKAQPAVFPKGSLGLQVSMHNKEHLLACSAFY